MNQSDNISTVNLSDSLYLDFDSNEVCGSIQLQPYTSVVLINTLTTCTTTKIAEINQGDFNFYPNPASAEINLVNVDNESIYNIYSASGQIVKTDRCANKTISTRDLAPGIYFIQIISKENSKCKSLIIE